MLFIDLTCFRRIDASMLIEGLGILERWGLTADKYRGEVHIFLNRSQVSTRDMKDFMEVIIHEGIHVLEYRFGPWNLEGNEHLGHSDRFHHWCDELLKNKVEGYDWDPCVKRWKEEECPFCIKRAIRDERDQH
uniref:SprT-like domain-containing protein n=1 Tax=Acrobeloides nanus TaxID=290746 RepID=A0A914E4S3_9BILA